MVKRPGSKTKVQIEEDTPASVSALSTGENRGGGPYLCTLMSTNTYMHHTHICISLTVVLIED